MAHGRTNARNTTDIFALIRVKYAEGWTCVCTNGAICLTAIHSDGVWIFNIPYAGEWTVMASCDWYKLIKTVDVVSGQCVDVRLTDLFLVGEGADIVGFPKSSWTSLATHDADGANSIVDISDSMNYIKWRLNDYKESTAIVQCSEPIDLTYVKKISCRCEMYAIASRFDLTLGFIESVADNASPTFIESVSKPSDGNPDSIIGANDIYELVLDTSELSGEVYICYRVSTSTANYDIFEGEDLPSSSAVIDITNTIISFV